MSKNPTLYTMSLERRCHSGDRERRGEILNSWSLPEIIKETGNKLICNLLNCISTIKQNGSLK